MDSKPQQKKSKRRQTEQISAATRSSAFQRKKEAVLAELQSSEPDLSPKGEPDKATWPLIDLLNSHEDIVTTSSCSGRLSVFLDGSKALSNSEVEAAENVNSDRGRWLFSSHEPVDDASVTSLTSLLVGGRYQKYARDLAAGFKLSETSRLVHFKFEPMIMHIATSHSEIAQKVLQCAIAASFRESGISGSKWPVVGVRTNGLMFDSPIGVLDEISGEIRLIVTEEGLKLLVQLCNIRFAENTKRTKAFTEGIKKMIDEQNAAKPENPSEPATEYRKHDRQKRPFRESDAGVSLGLDDSVDFGISTFLEE